jgi:hypothetical protein
VSTASTSLVLSSETVPTPQWCERRIGRYFRSLEVPSKVFRSGCDSYGCPVCGPLKVRAFALGIAFTLNQHERARHVTLTQTPREWQKTRQKMRSTALKVRAAGYACEWAWVVEENPRKTGFHIHATQWGDFIPQRKLQRIWGKRVYLQGIERDATAVAVYGAKGAAAAALYGAKGAETDFAKGLDLNGGRWFHTSRGFFPPGGVRKAVTQAKAAQRRSGGHTWVPLAPEAVAFHLSLASLPVEEQVKAVKGSLALRSVPE